MSIFKLAAQQPLVNQFKSLTKPNKKSTI